jgi:hypothetical protein
MCACLTYFLLGAIRCEVGGARNSQRIVRPRCGSGTSTCEGRRSPWPHNGYETSVRRTIPRPEATAARIAGISYRFSLWFAGISYRFSLRFAGISYRFSLRFAGISYRFSPLRVFCTELEAENRCKSVQNTRNGAKPCTPEREGGANPKDPPRTSETKPGHIVGSPSPRDPDKPCPQQRENRKHPSRAKPPRHTRQDPAVSEQHHTYPRTPSR